MSTSLFDKIEGALKKINEISSIEREVEINEQKIVLGLIKGEDEDAAQAYIAERASKFGSGMFLRDAKIESLSYAIKSVSGIRIDKVDFFIVRTAKGDLVEETKVERHILLRDKLRSWPPFVVNYLWNQYVLLIDQASKTFKPNFEIEGAKDLLQEEIKKEEEILSAAKELAKEELEPASKPKEFREIKPSDEGVLDQSGY